jgi:hypothetical protein
MRRRSFIELAGAATAGAFMTGTGAPSLASAPFDARPAAAKPLLAKDVAAYLRSLAEVEEPSVDRIVIGDPETEVTNIGTAWLPYWETCRQAARDGVNLLIVHEPTFYTHWDLDEKSPDLFAASAAGKEAYGKAVGLKKEWILTNKMVIIRCHDVEDKIGGFGIPYAFGRLLGLRDDDIIRSKPYYNVYRTKPRPAIDMARTIAAKMVEVRQPGVAFYGDKNRIVDSVGVGTGCYSDPIEFMDLAPALFVSIDDVVRTWTQTVYARDTGHPLVVVNHGATEEAGVQGLSEHLKRIYADRKVVHYAQGCGYEWVSGGGA